MQHYFDLHIHPVTKTMFKESNNQLSPWQVINVNDDMFGNALDSQASLGQIARLKGMNLICMPMMAPEAAIMSQWQLLFGSYFYNEIDFSRIRDMGRNRVDYQSVLKDEWRNLQQAPIAEDGADLVHKKVKLLRSFAEYDEDDLDTIHVTFSVEGLHNFYGPGNNVVDETDIINNMKALIDKGYLLLYITPAHLAPNVMINHAYGMKILNKGLFLPVEDGIVTDRPGGMQKNCYDLFNMAHDNGIAIDVKHMSLKARRLFYEHRNTNWPDRPIFASHVGFAGISKKQIPDYCHDVVNYIMPGSNGYKLSYKRPEGHLSGTYFNPCSINMYDEDLVEVLQSGGLIGLSLDVRIMSGDTDRKGRPKTTDYEYVSRSELAEFGMTPTGKSLKVEAVDGTDEQVEIITAEDLAEYQQEMTDMLELTNQRNDHHHLRSFINHLLHLCVLHERHQLFNHPLTQVCIGSDFDGLIQALHCCTSVTGLPAFAQELKDALPYCANEVGLTLPFSAGEIVDRLMYRNAKEFFERL